MDSNCGHRLQSLLQCLASSAFYPHEVVKCASLFWLSNNKTATVGIGTFSLHRWTHGLGQLAWSKGCSALFCINEINSVIMLRAL